MFRGGIVNSRRYISAGTLMMTAMTLAAPDALGQEGWIDGRPVFQSEIRREQQLMDRERAARRQLNNVQYPPFMQGGPRPEIVPEEPPVVPLLRAENPGSIIIDTGGRRLYYVLSRNRAFEYPISVGREGFTWTGTEVISRIADWPDWRPPAEMRVREPGLPQIMTGGLNNPLGAKALYLGNTLYRIHGTNDAKTIGLAASSGCFRMMNEHVTHLATVAGIGTKVRVVASYRGAMSAVR